MGPLVYKTGTTGLQDWDDWSTGLGRSIYLTDEMAVMVDRMERNGLCINMKKTQFMVLNRKCREADVADLEIEVNDEAIARCNNVQFWGVTVDRQLN